MHSYNYTWYPNYLSLHQLTVPMISFSMMGHSQGQFYYANQLVYLKVPINVYIYIN